MPRTRRQRQRVPVADAGGLIAEIESCLGWKLAPRQRVEALQRAADGASAAALADRYQRLETARTALNDPRLRAHAAPPARAEGSDPRRIAPTSAATWTP